MQKGKALVISVGGSPEPIVKTIQHHLPEFVSFFPSQGTSDTVAIVKSRLLAEQITFLSETTLVDNENDLLDCYRKADEAIKRVFSRGYSSSDLVVDYTGGTKNMSVSLALAAIDKGYCFSYVGGETRTKGGVGIVESGSEKIYSNVNPWDFLGVDERRRASGFFNKAQYAASEAIFRELSERATSRKTLYRRLAMISEGFYNWDLFRHKDALVCLKNANIEEMMEINGDEGVHKLARACHSLYQQLDVIMRCSENSKKPCLELAHDLYANAMRRIQEGKVDDAVLRLYRLVEMLAQTELLAVYGIDVSHVKPEQLPISVRESYIHTYTNARDNKIKLPQYACFSLLNELGNPLGTVYREHENQFKSVQDARNSSYLAHGFNSTKLETFEKLRDFVLTLGVIKPDEVPRFPTMEL